MENLPILVRVDEKKREAVTFFLDGAPVDALEGDTVLTAILTNTGRLRVTEFCGLPRAGFCMLGACQDCWVISESGARTRACSTFVASGLHLRTSPAQPLSLPPPVDLWPPGALSERS